MADVARFAYETGHRSNEIRKLCWSHLDDDAIRVPGEFAKNREDDRIALTEEIEKVHRRKADGRPGCDLIFHHDGAPMSTTASAGIRHVSVWDSGAYYCRDCRDTAGTYTSKTGHKTASMFKR